MQYLTFGEERSTYPVCILVNDLRKDEIKKAYLTPYGLDENSVIAVKVHKGLGKKTSAAEMKEWLSSELSPWLQDVGVEYLLIGDGDYFKTITGASKVDTKLGYVMDNKFGPEKAIYVPNYRTLYYDPKGVGAKIALGIEALAAWVSGTYKDPGLEIIKFAAYPQTVPEIAQWLQKLLQEPTLTCDIEAFSLKHFSAGIGTITFCWNENEGIAFPVDYIAEAWEDEKDVKYYGKQGHNAEVRKLLKAFFESYEGNLTFHSIAYDAYVLIYQLFMDHILDNEGLLYGLEVMLRGWDDTKLITYLATNSCAGNKLKLKQQAQAFAGDYAQDEIKDIRKIPLPQLLQYNLVDGLATHFVKNKRYPQMVNDNQLEIYETIFKPATVDIIQMQLTGMPLDMERVKEVKVLLQQDNDDAVNRMQASPVVQRFLYRLKEDYVEKRNQKLKTKRISISDPEVDLVVFNPNSNIQLQKLLFEELALPVLARTDTKEPATDGDTLKALKNHTKNPDIINFLNALVDYKAVNKILTSFIPAMEGAQRGPDGWYYLFGNFNLGGTVSGRLSSSDPNLQNLPANSKYAKWIKSCFRAPPGWLFVGIDFASLEDRISALTTKDPNKLKVYTDGFDGHSMRAVAYFGDMMPDIDPNDVNSVNTLADKAHENAKKYGVYRQDSKVPTFLLTYGGTYMGIMQQAGFPLEKAKQIEKQYHELYKVSDQWVAEKVTEATKTGYVTVAFGLRVRTPLLHQVVRGTRTTPFEAEAEGRTAGNALGQSWCLLNSRAGSETMAKVRANDNFRHAIKPCAQIHDAQYFLVRDDIECLEYLNDVVVKACQWQDHPDIWHDEVKLGGELSVFYPTWADEMVIPNNANQNEIREAFEKHYNKVHKIA